MGSSARDLVALTNEALSISITQKKSIIVYKSQAETGEIKGHYLNATAGTCA
jgi:hypothetical protein